MKTISIAITLALTLVITGCTTTGSGLKDVDPKVAIPLSHTIRGLANLGTQLLIRERPDTRAYILLAVPFLRALDIGLSDKAAVLEALRTAPIPELQDPAVLALVDPLLDILEGERLRWGVDVFRDRAGWQAIYDAFLDGVSAGAR